MYAAEGRYGCGQRLAETWPKRQKGPSEKGWLRAKK